MCMPPISTLCAGFRATCVKLAGAVAWTMCRASPRGKRTRSPSISAPAAASIVQRLGDAAEVDPDLLQHGVGVRLDQRQLFLVEHLERLQRAGDVRDGDGVRDGAGCLPGGPAAAAAASGRIGHAGLLCGDERRRRPPSAGAARRRGGRVTAARSRS